MATMTVAVHSKRLLSPLWIPDGGPPEGLELHITRISAYDDQDGNLKSVVVRMFCTQRVGWLPVGSTGELTAFIKMPGETGEIRSYPYGRLKVTANFVSDAGTERIVEWLIAFKPVKD